MTEGSAVLVGGHEELKRSIGLTNKVICDFGKNQNSLKTRAEFSSAPIKVYHIS